MTPTALAATTGAAADQPDVTDRWQGLRHRLAATGALLVPGELTGDGLSVQLDPADSDVLVSLLERGLAHVAYISEQTWTAAELAEASRTARELLTAADRPWLEPSLFEAELAAVRDAHAAALEALAVTAAHTGEVAVRLACVVVGGVSHTVAFLSEWLRVWAERLSALQQASVALTEPDEHADERTWLAREQQRTTEAAERAAETAERAAALEACGQALFQACVTDETFRKLGKEEDRWAHALTLVEPLTTWGELTQPDRGVLRPKVRAAYTHLRTTVADQSRRAVHAHLDEHAAAVRTLWAQQPTRTLKARTRIVRGYLAELDPLLSEASLIDTLAAAAAVEG